MSKTANNTCLLNIKDSIKEINKSVYNDLKLRLQWLNANKTSLNIAKAKVVIFRRKHEVFDTDQQLKLSGKKLKYLGVRIDEHLEWTFHVNQIS